MPTDFFWIKAPTPGRLAIMPRPRGGDWLEDEVNAWRAAGVDVLVSLLTPDEVADLGLGDEPKLCEGVGIDFIGFAIADRAVPESKDRALTLAAELAGRLGEGKNIAIHCRQGLGRAPLLAIAVLVLAGLDLKSASANVAAARRCPVPETAEQERWLADFARGRPALI